MEMTNNQTAAFLIKMELEKKEKMIAELEEGNKMYEEANAGFLAEDGYSEILRLKEEIRKGYAAIRDLENRGEEGER